MNYRRPVLANSTYVVEVKAERVERAKKVYLTATVSDVQGRACAEATALYIVTKPKTKPKAEDDLRSRRWSDEIPSVVSVKGQ